MTSTLDQDQTPGESVRSKSSDKSILSENEPHGHALDASQVISLLLKAKGLAESGRTTEARELLARILVPILERPWILTLWGKLLRSLGPDQEERFQSALRKWIRTAESILRDAAADSRPTEEAASLVSKTLARLYWNQGYRERALEMYRTLVLKDPRDRELAREFHERLMAAKGAQSSKNKAIFALEKLADRIVQTKRVLPKKPRHVR